MPNQAQIQQCIDRHLHMAESIAKRYARRGMSEAVLREAADAALREAAQRYDSPDDRGFSLYASNAIRQAMVREVATADLGPRLSVRTVEHLNQIQKSIYHREQALGRTLTQEEMAQELSQLTAEERTQILNHLT